MRNMKLITLYIKQVCNNFSAASSASFVSLKSDNYYNYYNSVRSQGFASGPCDSAFTEMKKTLSSRFFICMIRRFDVIHPTTLA